MQRIGTVIRLKPGMEAEYVRLHREASEEIRAAHRKYHYTNFTIFRKDDLLFSYYEYDGEDWEADQKRMDSDPVMIRWRQTCRPLMEPLPNRRVGEWQASMEPIFRID